jgi:hypothetical protein
MDRRAVALPDVTLALYATGCLPSSVAVGPRLTPNFGATQDNQARDSRFYAIPRLDLFEKQPTRELQRRLGPLPGGGSLARPGVPAGPEELVRP